MESAIDRWIVVFLIIYSVTLHELGHAFVATWCGDPTPGKHGRLTWNPLVQLHPVYSVVLPIVTYLWIGFPLGWAYCPIDPSRFRNPLRDRALTALAGPAMNFAIVAVCLGALWTPWLTRLYDPVPPDFLPTPSHNLMIFFGLAFWNLLLGVFNLLPLPGLDGYDVLRPLLPLGIRRPLDNFRTMGFIPLMLAMVIGSNLFPYVLRPVYYKFEQLIPAEKLIVKEYWFNR